MRAPSRGMLLAGVLTTAVAALSFPVRAQDRAPTVPESIVEGMQVVDPLAFQATAAAWNTFFIRASELALERGSGEATQALARELVDAHAALAPALARASEADALPTAPVVGLDGRQSGMIGRLEAAPDAEFDRLYLDMLQSAYDESLGLFGGYATNGADGSLKAFAAESVPILETRRSTVARLMESEATEPS